MAAALKGYDPVTIQPWLERVLIAMPILALCVTCLRVYSRRLNHQDLWWDDYLAMFSVSWLLVDVVLISVDVALGLGRHTDSISMAAIVTMVKITLVVDTVYIWNLVWSKLSLLFLYYRVFRFGYFKRAGYAVGGLVVAWAITATLLTYFYCFPLSKMWELQASKPGHCIDSTAIRLFNAAVTIATDVMILCLPMPQIWSLQNLGSAKKTGLSVVFAMGFLVVFISSVRIPVFLHDLSQDMTYTLAPDAGWLVIEMTAAVVSVSFPTLGPALIEINRKLRSTCTGIRELGAAAVGNHPDRRQVTAMRHHEGSVDSAGRANTGNRRIEEEDGATLYHLSDFVKGHKGSSPSLEAGEVVDRPTTRETARDRHEDRRALSRLTVTPSQDGASDEVPLNGIRIRRSVSQSSTRAP